MTFFRRYPHCLIVFKNKTIGVIFPCLIPHIYHNSSPCICGGKIIDSVLVANDMADHWREQGFSYYTRP